MESESVVKKNLQECMPFLEKVLQTLPQNSVQYNKMKAMMDMVVNADKYKLSTLVKCYEVISLLKNNTKKKKSPDDTKLKQEECNGQYYEETTSVYTSAAQTVNKPKAQISFPSVDMSKPPIAVEDLPILPEAEPCTSDQKPSSDRDGYKSIPTEIPGIRNLNAYKIPRKSSTEDRHINKTSRIDSYSEGDFLKILNCNATFLPGTNNQSVRPFPSKKVDPRCRPVSQINMQRQPTCLEPTVPVAFHPFDPVGQEYCPPPPPPQELLVPGNYSTYKEWRQQKHNNLDERRKSMEKQEGLQFRRMRAQEVNKDDTDGMKNSGCSKKMELIAKKNFEFVPLGKPMLKTCTKPEKAEERDNKIDDLSAASEVEQKKDEVVVPALINPLESKESSVRLKCLGENVNIHKKTMDKPVDNDGAELENPKISHIQGSTGKVSKGGHNSLDQNWRIPKKTSKACKMDNLESSSVKKQPPENLESLKKSEKDGKILKADDIKTKKRIRSKSMEAKLEKEEIKDKKPDREPTENKLKIDSKKILKNNSIETNKDKTKRNGAENKKDLNMKSCLSPEHESKEIEKQDVTHNSECKKEPTVSYTRNAKPVPEEDTKKPEDLEEEMSDAQVITPKESSENKIKKLPKRKLIVKLEASDEKVLKKIKSQTTKSNDLLDSTVSENKNSEPILKQDEVESKTDPKSSTGDANLSLKTILNEDANENLTVEEKDVDTERINKALSLIEQFKQKVAESKCVDADMLNILGSAVKCLKSDQASDSISKEEEIVTFPNSSVVDPAPEKVISTEKKTENPPDDSITETSESKIVDSPVPKRGRGRRKTVVVEKELPKQSLIGRKRKPSEDAEPSREIPTDSVPSPSIVDNDKKKNRKKLKTELDRLHEDIKETLGDNVLSSRRLQSQATDKAESPKLVAATTTTSINTIETRKRKQPQPKEVVEESKEEKPERRVTRSSVKRSKTPPPTKSPSPPPNKSPTPSPAKSPPAPVNETSKKTEFVWPERDYYLDPLKDNECRLCSFVGRDIVLHYLTSHPQHDVSISRLNPEKTLHAISQNLLLPKDSLTKKKKKKQQKDDDIPEDIRRDYICIFCEFFLKKTTPIDFYEHLTSHTGEFIYSCTECDFKGNRIASIKIHMQHMHPGVLVSFRTLDPPPDDIRSGVVVGYVCSQCHFLQLHRDRLDEHAHVYHLQKGCRVHPINMSVAPLPKNAVTESNNEAPLVKDTISAKESKVTSAKKTENEAKATKASIAKEAKASKVNQSSPQTRRSSKRQLNAEKDNSHPASTSQIPAIDDSSNKCAKTNNAQEILSEVSTETSENAPFDPIETQQENMDESLIKQEDGSVDNIRVLRITGIEAVFSEPFDDPPLFICRLNSCGYSDKDRTSFRAHCRDDHSGRKVHFKCPHCSFNTLNPVIFLKIFQHFCEHVDAYLETVLHFNSVEDITIKQEVINVDESELIAADPIEQNMTSMPKIVSVTSLAEALNEIEDTSKEFFLTEFPELCMNVKKDEVSKPKESTESNQNVTLKALDEMKKVFNSNQSSIPYRKSSDVLEKWRDAEFMTCLFKCPLYDCPFLTHSQSNFELHFKEHNLQPKLNLACFYCNDQIAAEEYKQHVMIAHGNSLFGCSLCFYRAYSFKYVEVHAAEVHGTEKIIVLNLPPIDGAAEPLHTDNLQPLSTIIKPYTCYCKSSFYIWPHFLDHVKLEHSSISSNFQCVCGDKAFVNLTELKEHMSQKHNLCDLHCRYCGHGADNATNMRKHHVAQHPHITMKMVSRTVLTSELSTVLNNGSNVVDKLLVLKEMSSTAKPSGGIVDDQMQASYISDPPGLTFMIESNQESQNENKLVKTSVTVEQKDSPKNNVRKSFVGVELYRCCHCFNGFETSQLLIDHINKLEDAQKARARLCFHCHKSYRLVTHLVDHIRVHGPLNITCGLCGHKEPHRALFKKHFKFVHNYNGTDFSILPVHNELKFVKPDEQQFVISPSIQRLTDLTEEKDRNQSHEKQNTNSASIPSSEHTFGPGDISRLPLTPIFKFSAQCSICGFTNKVRTNFVRHMALHAKGGGDAVVSKEAPINPVPCLERNELMFDKMVNLAASSHQNSALLNRDKGSNETAGKNGSAEKIPQYVPITSRYVCGAKGCNYLCLEERILQHHLQALHDNETSYTCTHCNWQLNSERSFISIEAIIRHLRLHDLNLFGCPMCSHLDCTRNNVERHILEAHHSFNTNSLLAKKNVLVLRSVQVKSNGTALNENKTDNVSGRPSSGKPYKCNLCTKKNLSEEQIKDHVSKKHQFNKQYKCLFCNFGSDTRDAFEEHFATNHENRAEEVVVFYRKEEDREVSTISTKTTGTQEVFDTTPLWSKNRDSQVKHIRGILLEEKSLKLQVKKTPPSTLKQTVTSFASATPTGNANKKKKHDLLALRKQTLEEQILKEATDKKNSNQASNAKVNPPLPVVPLILSKGLFLTRTLMASMSDEELANGTFKCKWGEIAKLKPGGNYTCPMCKLYECGRAKDLMEHMMRELNVCTIECLKCSFLALNLDDLRKHLFDVHAIANIAENMYRRRQNLSEEDCRTEECVRLIVDFQSRVINHRVS